MGKKPHLPVETFRRVDEAEARTLEVDRINGVSQTQSQAGGLPTPPDTIATGSEGYRGPERIGRWAVRDPRIWLPPVDKNIVLVLDPSIPLH